MYSIKAFRWAILIFVFREGTNYWRAFRASYNTHDVRDTPPKVGRALNLLFVFAVVGLAYTLPYFSPENVFSKTSTRLQTSTDVIFARLTAIRPFTPFDETLKAKLTSKAARLIYFAYGPDAVVNCSFCSPSDSQSYLYYALPSLAAPHLLHLAVLGVVTSPFLSGSEGAQWRSHATLAGLSLAAADLYMHLTYDLNANTTSTNVHDIDFFYWRMRLLRGVATAVVDGLLGWALWLSATNRFFVSPPAPEQRLGLIQQALGQSNFRLWSTGNIRNTVVRDKELREGMTRYWNDEKEIYEDASVVRAIKNALNRTDMHALELEADRSSEGVMNAIET